MNDPPPNTEFDQLLDYLRQARSVDFAAYKRSTLMRRVIRRLKMVGVTSFADYVDYLQVHPEEFARLFDTILINVSSFFRDPAAWDYLRHQIVPAIIASKPEQEPIRIWSAGCAAGQEAYSLAMVLADALGIDAFLKRVKIYATDVDEDALIRARQGYTQTELEPVPEETRNTYFERQGSRFVFRASLRRPLIFGRHDLLQDAPISRLDLLSCRNTLMYFTAEAQERILARFHYALNEDGYLFLGRAEMLLTHGNLFRPVDLKQRVFKKVPQLQRIERLLPTQAGGRDRLVAVPRRVRLRDLAWELSPAAQLLLDGGGVLVMANRAARTLFGLSQRDMGKPLQDLRVSYRPLELRSQLERAEREHRTMVVSNVAYEVEDGSFRYFDVQVTPVIDEDDTLLGSSVLFIDITPHQRLRLELERTRQEVETAHEELQSSTEELQSTVEELETTNEELQSSNEELETMNEELESTNSELQALNADLRSRTEELDRTNLFLQSILTSVQVGVAVLDEAMRVNLWNRRAEDLWGLRDTEVIGRSFLSLEFGLPVSRLKGLIETALEAEEEQHEQVLEATTRRGKRIQCRVTAAPLVAVEAEVKGVVLLMEEVPGVTVDPTPDQAE
jgi:two-component system CheB/CheR fusion protein